MCRVCRFANQSQPVRSCRFDTWKDHEGVLPYSTWNLIHQIPRCTGQCMGPSTNLELRAIWNHSNWVKRVWPNDCLLPMLSIENTDMPAMDQWSVIVSSFSALRKDLWNHARLHVVCHSPNWSELNGATPRQLCKTLACMRCSFQNSDARLARDWNAIVCWLISSLCM